MPTVNFKINSKNYSVDCGAGQEEQIFSIASQIDAKVKQLSSMFGDVDSETLLLMVCILTFGDVSKAKAKVAGLEAEVNKLRSEMVDEDALSDLISQLTRKVKSLSVSLSNVDNDSVIDFNR